MRIGVISDTHNYLDPKVLEIFANVQHIFHAGDVGQNRIINDLAQLAPVTAVSGNTDLGLVYRDTELAVVDDDRFLLQHIVDPAYLDESLRQRARSEKAVGIVFGHTHRQHFSHHRKMFLLNPGYAGRPRFSQPRSIALLEKPAAEWTAQFVTL